ncbi:MAG: NACHT domain-containing protein [Cyanobacteria bacterium P01_G01_bin.39]
MKLTRWFFRKRFKYILLTSIFALTFASSVIFGLSLPIYSQTNTSTPCQKFIANKTKYASCEKLILDIHETAKRHVQGGESMQTLVIKQLYEHNSLEFTPPEIAQIYEDEYLRLKKENPWLQLPPSWLFALVACLGAIIYKFSEKWLVTSLDKIFSWFYYQLAGNPLLLRTALNRYRKSLVTRYQELKIVYRPNRPLDMAEVYVPLKVAGSNDSEQIDAKQAIVEYPRLMVKGVPGSGKSMLLKHLALIYGKEGGLNNLPAKSIPLLVELHELTDPALDLEKLEQHLVQVFERHDFPQAARFVSESLKQGKLLLLFDGLDEVNSDVRRRVVRVIKNLLQKYRKCPALITCRTAVYNDEFNDLVNQTLEIVEFNDRQMRLFLKSWSSQMLADKSIEQLLTTLRDKPRIMTLARNPLLLTIIAYLYCDTAFVLPDSRSEFYRKSTDVLLELRDEEKNLANQYRANEKRRVLQELALYNQDNAQAQQQDRRSINYEVVLAEIREVLPDLSLNPNQDTKAILREIVERSGLFIQIDSGDKYQFAHLSIQEFFAAEALTDNWHGLMVRYKKDPNAWRETVKLWCGLTGNSTELIKAIYNEDALLAFECLADAQEVDQDLAATIINQFKNQLGRSNNEDNLVKAFGAVAASSRIRGKEVFEFLRETLSFEAESPNRKSAAALALSLTNLPQAVEVFSSQYAFQADEVRAALIRMGDLAVPKLVSKTHEGYLEAINDLLAIATPVSANALVPFLWHSNQRLAGLTAWNLAILISQREIEESLHNFSLTKEERKANYLDWIWQPFPTPKNSALPIIAGRIAYLLKTSPINTISRLEQNPDPRILTPLCAIEIQEEIKNLKSHIDRISTIEVIISPGGLRMIDESIQNFIEELDTSSRWKLLFSGLDSELQENLLFCLKNYRIPNTSDWLNLFAEVTYKFKNSWHYYLVIVFALAMTILAIAQICMIIFSQPENGKNLLLFWEIFMIVIYWTYFWQDNGKKFDPDDFYRDGLFGFLFFWSDFSEVLSNKRTSTKVLFVFTIMIMAIVWIYVITWPWMDANNINRAWMDANNITWAVVFIIAISSCTFGITTSFKTDISTLSETIIGNWFKSVAYDDLNNFLFIFAYPFFCWSPIVFCFSTLALINFLSWQYTVLVWITVLGVGTALWMRGQELEVQARNPLKGILDQPEKLT